MFVLDVTLKDMEGTSKQHLKRKKSPELPQIGKTEKKRSDCNVDIFLRRL